jgi:hypothetical protein
LWGWGMSELFADRARWSHKHKVKVTSLCLTKHYAMKTYGRVDV